MVKEITSTADYDAEVSKEGVVVVDFFAVWCGPCRAVAPIIETMEKEYEEKETPVSFLKVDVDSLAELAARVGVSAMPTFFVYKDGKQIKTIVGANVPAIQSTLAEATGVTVAPVAIEPVGKE